jgi:hypothetical protein
MTTERTHTCAKCGKNLALVGRAHNCVPVVNSLVVNKTVVNRRGYPNTDTRRAYMRAYMAKRRNAVLNNVP